MIIEWRIQSPIKTHLEYIFFKAVGPFIIRAYVGGQLSKHHRHVTGYHEQINSEHARYLLDSPDMVIDNSYNSYFGFHWLKGHFK